MDKKDSVKSHEEIMALFDELEDLEHRIRVPEAGQVPLETVISQDEELPAPEVSVPEPGPKTPVTKTRTLFQMRLHGPWKRSPIYKRQRLFEVETVDSKDSARNTFSLRLDDDGNLLGFDHPKPKPPRITLFRRNKKTEGEGEPEPTGRFARLRRVLSRKRASSEGKTSKLSGVLGRFKGLGRRRGKE